MAEVKDLSIVDDDFEFANGDFRVLDSDQQHVEHIIKADKGHFRQFPLIGVGIDKKQHGNLTVQALKQDIKLQLRSDNYAVRQVILDEVGQEFNISIDAKRIKL